MTRFKDFRIGDVFSVQHVKKLSFPGKPYVMDKDIISKNGQYPYIAAISRNNGISGYTNYEPNNAGDCVTLSTTADSSNTVFYQPDDFVGRQQIAEIRRKDGKSMGLRCGLFVATIIRILTKQFNYANKLTIDYLCDSHVSLPVTTVVVPDWRMLETLLKVHEGGGADMSKIDTSSWKKFKISALFGKAKLGKYHNPETLTIDPNGYEYICASNLNNGVNKDMPRVTGDNLSLTAPNIIAWGKQCPMFTWHESQCVTSQGMYYIELGELSEGCALFLITLLTHACHGQYGYNNCLIGSKFDEIEILLPVTAMEVPDWDYMQERIAELEQERIAELEQERIAELEQYLVATGLNDYTLTDEDLKTLSLSGFRSDEAGNRPAAPGVRKEMRRFKISDVFSLRKGQRLTKADQLPGNTPFIGSTESNNGVTGYIGQKPIFDGNAITVSYNGSVGQVFYQEQPFWASDDINVLYLKDHTLDRELFGYLAASLYRAGKAFSYTFKWNLERMRDTMFVLPIQTDAAGQPVIDQAKTYHPDGFMPDWEYMAAYIRAVEKLVIRDVVDFKDAFIANAKLAVAGKEAV